MGTSGPFWDYGIGADLSDSRKKTDYPNYPDETYQESEPAVDREAIESGISLDYIKLKA